MAHSTAYRLWECMACMHATSINFSPELNTQKKFWKAAYLSDRVHSRGFQESAANEETYTVKTCSINGSVKNLFASLDC